MQVFTKDGIVRLLDSVPPRTGIYTDARQPVIWHDWLIEPDKCTDTVPGANFVGKVLRVRGQKLKNSANIRRAQYIANLTLAEVKVSVS